MESGLQLHEIYYKEGLYVANCWIDFGRFGDYFRGYWDNLFQEKEESSETEYCKRKHDLWKRSFAKYMRLFLLKNCLFDLNLFFVLI